jgi:hypothetical protein
LAAGRTALPALGDAAFFAGALLLPAMDSLVAAAAGLVRAVFCALSVPGTPRAP